jgi:cytochrome c oxidase subunit IV
LVIVVAAVLVLATPIWMHFAITAAGGGIPGLSLDESLQVSDSTVNQLLFGPGDFRIETPCTIVRTNCSLVGKVYLEDEAAHLRDARAVLYLFVALALAALALIVAALVHRPSDARRWQQVALGGAGLAVGVIVLGVVAFVAFDAAFELFHRIFFPGGNWAFPADSNMIRLYPEAFWQLTAAALGLLCGVGGGAVWWLARRRASSLAQ